MVSEGGEQNCVAPILFGELISLVENKYFLKTGISSTSLLFFFFFLLDSSKVGKIPKT